MLLFVLRLDMCFFTPEELAYRPLAHRPSSVGYCWMLVQNGWNSVQFLVPLSASQTPALQAPGRSFGGASAVAAQSAQGDCQSGTVPVACCHILFFLPLPKGVGSLLTVCGAAVVGAFTGDT